MKRKAFTASVLSLILLFSLTGCRKSDADKSDTSTDGFIGDAGDGLEDAKDNIDDAMDDAMKDTEDALQDAGDAVMGDDDNTSSSGNSQNSDDTRDPNLDMYETDTNDGVNDSQHSSD